PSSPPARPCVTPSPANRQFLPRNDQAPPRRGLFFRLFMRAEILSQCAVGLAHLAQRLTFDLADSLAADALLLGEAFQRGTLVPTAQATLLVHHGQAEAAADHVALLVLQVLQQALDRDLVHRAHEQLVVGTDAVGDRRAALGHLIAVAVLKAALQRHDVGHGAGVLEDVLVRQPALLGQLVDGRLAALALAEALRLAAQLVDLVNDVLGHADDRLVADDVAQDALTDPPGGVGAQAVALARIELVNRRHQADVALADQVREGNPHVPVLLGDVEHEAQVGLDQTAPAVLAQDR